MAMRHYKEALHLAETKYLNQLRFSILNKLAECYTRKGDYDVAMFYAKEAAKCVKISMDRTKINVTLCKLYINFKQWNIAESCLNAVNLDTTGLMIKWSITAIYQR